MNPKASRTDNIRAAASDGNAEITAESHEMALRHRHRNTAQKARQAQKHERRVRAEAEHRRTRHQPMPAFEAAHDPRQLPEEQE